MYINFITSFAGLLTSSENVVDNVHWVTAEGPYHIQMGKMEKCRVDDSTISN